MERTKPISREALKNNFIPIETKSLLNSIDYNKEGTEIQLQSECEWAISQMFDLIPDLALTEGITFEQLGEFEFNVDKVEERSRPDKPLEQNILEGLTTEEPVYESPTIEVEKKGLAKWFDKLKQSRKPFARIITGQLSKSKDNLLLNETNDKIYEDKPSTGRFDATDTQLMPVGKGSRNSIIQAMDKISNLFRRNKKERQPAKVMEPVTPNNAFEARYVVDKDSLESNNVIVPTAVNQKVNAVDKKEGTPVIEEDSLSI